MTVYPVEIEDLPPEMEGLTIMHLSDLHIDRNPELAKTISNKTNNVKVDIVFLTGDYMDHYHANLEEVCFLIKKACKNIDSTYGFYAVLGNHDTYNLIPYLSKIGIKTILNATHTVTTHYGDLIITGIDDSHSFFSPQILEAMDEAPTRSENAIRILLAHSPEAYKWAANRLYQIYLTGHTHGGQICLPGGKAIITGDCERSQIKGKWVYKKMVGLTSPGVGVSGLTLRLFCPAEIPIYILKTQRS